MKTLYLLPLHWLAACSPSEQPATEVKNAPTAVHVAEVLDQDYAKPIIITGSLSSDREARLSFATGGVISRILVREGESVKKGQLLATLDLTPISSQTKQAEEAVSKAERDFQRVKALYQDSAATLEQFQNTRTGLEVARQGLKQAGFQESFSQLRAPADGKILFKLMNEGEVTGAGNPVLVVNATGSGQWMLKAGVSDKDWLRLKRGNQAAITLDAAPNETIQATITDLAEAANPMTGTFEVGLRLSTNPTSVALASGLIAKAKIQPSSNGKSIMVPVEALLEANENEDSNLRKRPIVGLILFKDFVYEDEKWVDGRIYDPNNGKTYQCKISFEEEKLQIRGYIGISMFGRTKVWERVK